MTQQQEQIIQATKEYVRNELKDAEGGHDWFHIERVYRNAVLISESEDVDEFIVTLGALLHDIADSKFHDGDETVGPEKAREFLGILGVDPEDISSVVAIIENVSYGGGNKEQTSHSKELQVVQDADRLDAMGAIGIARAFNYGGFKDRTIYDPSIAPNTEMTPEEYKASTAPTVNHFYEKLLLLKERMNTATGRRIAKARHAYMEGFLKQFYSEWKGER